LGSPGIDSWIAKAPKSWAKLAKKAKKTDSFEQFKTKFFEGAEAENKGYLKQYLTNEQLQHIYEKGFGGTITRGGGSPIQTKPTKTKLEVQRNGKTYTRSNTPRWSNNMSFVLKLAAREKPKSKEYYKYLDILIAQGRTRQAAVKKIQRTRKELSK
jgi:hypothetical protein